MGQGFVKALTLINLLAMAGGVTLGIIIGCLPGLSAAMGVALMLPLTFTMPADTGLIVLGAIYCGAICGGSISAILIHTPGTPASAATAIEGYQMTLKGQAGKALATACWSSFWGGLLSCISLYFFSPLLAQLALKFMSAEKFWLGIFGLTIIAGVSSKSIVKGLMTGALGLLICRTGTEILRKRSDVSFLRRVLDCNRVFLSFGAPLLLVAALVEAYITPALLKLVM